MKYLSIRQIKRFDEIDYLRGFAILAVIAIHISDSFTHMKNVNMLLMINVIIDVFSQFAVPLFIFISGFVLSLKYKGLFSRKIFYKKRAKSILPQYIIFSVLYILLNVVTSTIDGTLKFPSMVKVIFYFFTASSYYHLWFFALIIQFYIFYPYIIKLYENFMNNGKIFLFIFLMLIIQQVSLILRGLVLDYFTSNTHINSTTYFVKILETFLNRAFFSYIFYFTIGIYACQNYEYIIEKVFKTKKWIIPTIILITGVISALWINGITKYGGYYNIPNSCLIICNILYSIYYTFIFSILLLISLNFLNNKSKYSKYLKVISLIGKHSFGIYLIHPLYITIIITLIFPYFNIDFNHYIFYPILFILTLMLSYFSIDLMSYLPYSEIIGVKKHNCT
jgi:surface polysaccharide O-acyltransferase-like enzyme